MTSKFQKLKRYFLVDSQVLSAMMIAYVVLFATIIISISKTSASGNEQNEGMGMKQTTISTTSLHTGN
jgi:uncharacterized protein YpmS